MIVAVAAAAILATPSRDALIARWVHSNPAHSQARLEAERFDSRAKSVLPDLHALAQREFSVAGRYQLIVSPPAPPATQPWWMGALRWLGGRWQQLWRTIFARIRIGKSEAAGVGDGVLLIVGLALLFVVIRLARNVRLERSRSRCTAQPLEEPPNPLSLYQRACNAATSGEYGNAALLLFAATVALLDTRGALEASSSATVGDLRRELRARNVALIAPFDAVAAPFVDKAYAERTVNEPQWNRARDAFAALLQGGRP